MDEQSQLRSIADRLESIESRLSAIETAGHEALQSHKVTDAEYRKELSNYRDEDGKLAYGRAVALVARILVLLLVVYIAYRVS